MFLDIVQSITLNQLQSPLGFILILFICLVLQFTWFPSSPIMLYVFNFTSPAFAILVYISSAFINPLLQLYILRKVFLVSSVKRKLPKFAKSVYIKNFQQLLLLKMLTPIPSRVTTVMCVHSKNITLSSFSLCCLISSLPSIIIIFISIYFSKRVSLYFELNPFYTYAITCFVYAMILLVCKRMIKSIRLNTFCK